MNGILTDFFALEQYVYKPLVISDGVPRTLFGAIIVLAGSLALLGVSIWGIASEASVGLGLEEFFPENHQASVWAHTSAEHLAGWSITINWGRITKHQICVNPCECSSSNQCYCLLVRYRCT